MGGAGHRVFRDPGMGREVARDEVAILARRRDDQAVVQVFHLREVGIGGQDRLLVREQGQIFHGTVHLQRPAAERFGDRLRGLRRDRLGRLGWKVQGVDLALAGDIKRTASAVEAQEIAAGLQVLVDDVGARQGGVAAEVDLDRRCEPAQVVVAVVPREEVGRLSQVVLRRDGLQDLVREPGLQRAHGRRVSGEDARGEGIDLIDRDFSGHAKILPCLAGCIL